ncbi:pentapeptide repeat-containing protein [Nostoc sp. TCL26-01]|uniref:pentapeptide repeat-containing protein n=1 Tax=Nostoc sp. TCL26-01 TaxID=2576904 RepID=UPI0015BA2D97|nr:pentapeptide repeat-containing protein [Nostoc sp. TCL26-01]QLE57099.1 pentapeptide repeat-containing protein [Nostoc sp. TCL26-01]
MNSDRLNFCNQNLQNRSFTGLQLNDANFSGADLRGCDFRHAQLQRVNFVKAKFGQSPRVFISLLITALIVGLIVFTAISEMGFGVLGNTPELPAWNYTQALVISLLISGISASFRRVFPAQPILEKIITILSGIASAALMGFYYGGIFYNKNPQAAVISALIASMITAILCLTFQNGWIRVIIAVAGFICNYSLAFLISSVAFAYLSIQHYIIGGFWGILTLILLALTMRSLKLVIQEITKTGITNFRGANLEDAKFDAEFKLNKVYFTGVIL